MSDFEQLKPCPFCGGGASEGSVGSSVPGSDDDGYLYIECPQCNGAYGKPFIGVHGDDKDVLRGIWNTRSAKQSMQGEAVYLVIDHDTLWRQVGKSEYDRTEENNRMLTFTHAPDSAARIAELEIRQQQLETQLSMLATVAEAKDARISEQSAEIARLTKELDVYKQAIDDMTEVYSKNKSRSWVMQCLRDRIDAAIRQIGGVE